MASTVDNSVEIKRPVDVVFAFVNDYKNTTRYIVGMAQYKPTTKQTEGKGARFSLVKKTSGAPDIKSEVEITDWVENKKIAFKSISGFDNGGAYTFASRGDATTVKFSNTYDISSLIGGGRGGIFGGIARAAGGVASKAIEGQVRKDLTSSLDKLKDLVEAQSAPAKKAATVKQATPAKKAPTARKAAPKPTARRAASKKAAPGR